MQVIRATDICDGLIVDNLPSLRSSASSWFNVTNSASIATMSPETHQFEIVYYFGGERTRFPDQYCVQVARNKN
jgi:hypothetical protein